MNDIERKRLEKAKRLAPQGGVSSHTIAYKSFQYRAEMKLVRYAIAEVMGVSRKRIAKRWVHDDSTPSDFAMDAEDCARLARFLGVAVNQRDYLWQVAVRLTKR